MLTTILPTVVGGTEIQLQSFSNYTAYFPAADAATQCACLLLHGFPALPVPGFEQCEKNIDIARVVPQKLGVDTFITHYKGLGRSSGQFSFFDSVSQSIATAKKICRRFGYSRMHLIGHSWGGLVATNTYFALPADQRGNMVLMAPFNHFPEDAVFRRLLESISNDPAVKFQAQDMDGIMEEIERVKKKFNPRTVAKILAAEQAPGLGGITFLQPTIDDEVPTESVQEFSKLFGNNTHYFEVESDHKFLKRRDVIVDLVVTALSYAC